MALRSLGAYGALVLSVFLACPVWAAAPTRSRTYTTGQTIEAGDVTTNEDNIFSYLQAGVDTYAVGSVNAAAIADNAVGSSEVADDAIGATEIATDAVGSAEIAADAVGTSEIATDGVAAAEIAAGAVGASEIASGAVDAVDMVTTGTIADDKAFIADSSTAGTWRTMPNCTDTGGNHLNYTQSTNSFSCGTSSTSSFAVYIGSFSRDTATASGTQSVTGVGFQPTACLFFGAASSATAEVSWGADNDTANFCISDNHNATADTFGLNSDSSIRWVESGADRYEGTITTLGADGFTITWTKTGSPTGTNTSQFLCFD